MSPVSDLPLRLERRVLSYVDGVQVVSGNLLAPSQKPWPSPGRSTAYTAGFNGSMVHTTGYFHLHLISDATGETLITVARAAAAQYARVMPVEHVHPLVRTQKQLDRVLAEIEESPGI